MMAAAITVKDDELIEVTGRTIGRIEDSKIFNAQGGLMMSFEGNIIYDAADNKFAFLEDSVIRNFENEVIGTLEGASSLIDGAEGVVLAAIWLSFMSE